jgi:hypothetical protein
MSKKSSTFGWVLDIILNNLQEKTLEEKRAFLVETGLQKKIDESVAKFIAESHARAAARQSTSLSLEIGAGAGNNWENVVIGDNIEELQIGTANPHEIGNITDNDLVKISNKTNLERISIHRMPITGKAFKVLSNLKSLRSIVVYDAKPMHELFEYTCNFPNLESISIHNSKLSGSNWNKLWNNVKLQSIGCGNCSLTDEDLANFPSLPNIDVLYFGNNDLTCLNFGFIRDMQRLECIDVRNNCKFGRDGLKIITEACKNTLTDIIPQNCPLIDDSCIKYFLPLKKIQVISFTGTNVSEAGIGKLKSLKTLRHLFLPEHVSVEFARKLQEKYLPKCYFSWTNNHEKDLGALEWSEDYD